MTTSAPALPLARLPEVWRRFLVAVLGLGCSFAAALFSTVTRDAGNVLGTAILAGASLLVAVWVGMTTVPYLARRAAAEVNWQDSVDFEVTRAGIVYILATLLIGVAALNTGNNLLYLIVSTMLGAVLVSGVCSGLVLRGLILHVNLPQHVFAREAAAGTLELRNSRRWLPSLSISIVPPKERKVREEWRAQDGRLGFPPHWPRERQWLNIRDWKIRRVPVAPVVPSLFQGSVYFALLPARSSARSEIQLQFQRRGIYRQDAFALATAFPFSLLVKKRNVNVAHELVVYPAVDVTPEMAQALSGVASDLSSLHVGTGQDLLRIRPYEAGDSARHVDWKASAKSGALKVREFARDEQTRLRIVFDNPVSGELSTASYERAVQLAASLAWYFAQISDAVTFVAPGFEPSPNIWEFLRFLALIEPREVVPKAVESGLSQSILPDLQETGEFNLIVTAQPQSRIPAALRPMSRICP